MRIGWVVIVACASMGCTIDVSSVHVASVPVFSKPSEGVTLELLPAVTDDTGYYGPGHLTGFRGAIINGFTDTFGGDSDANGHLTLRIERASLAWTWLGRAGSVADLRFAATVLAADGVPICHSSDVLRPQQRVGIGGVDEPWVVSGAMAELYKRITNDCFGASMIPRPAPKLGTN